jgi:phage regulator Rha-like protein
MTKSISIPDEIVISKIYVIRGQKVMIDRDLAELYGVETKRLKEAVRRNIDRFPTDFMFEMSGEEFVEWREVNITESEDRQGLRYAPFCFTEQGVTMLSCVLSSKKAIEVNIQIIRIFAKLRELILTHKDILLKLEQLEKKVLSQETDISLIFKYLKELLNPNTQTMKRIGFRPKGVE